MFTGNSFPVVCSTEHLQLSDCLHSSFSKQQLQISRYCSPSSTRLALSNATGLQSAQQPPLNAGSLAHLIIFTPSQPKRKPKTIAVAASTHHPPFHKRNTREPMKSTMVIWIQESEHVASPFIALLSKARASQRFGSQRKTMMTRAEADMMREELDESGSWCSTRLAMELASVARERASRRIPMMSVARFSNLFRR